MSFIGQTLGGRYRILERMGQGAMGEVYLAEHTGLRRHYAVKVLKESLQGDQSMVERFRREAQATSRLEHPNIVYVTDCGQAPDGRPYLAMEYIKGQLLRDVLDDIEPALMSVGSSLRILRQICAAMQVAHREGVVHRDLKPENVMLKDQHGETVVKIMDFGLAKMLVDTGDSPLTRKGQVFGTPDYMAPEQAMGKPIDHRTDIYAFGILSYEVLTGRHPFEEAVEIPDMLRAQLNKTPPPLSQLRPPQEPALPTTVAGILERCMAKDPGARPRGAEELITVIDAALQELGESGPGKITIPPPSEDEVVLRWTGKPPITAPSGPSAAGPDAAREIWWGTLCRRATELGRNVVEFGAADDVLTQLVSDITTADETVTQHETDLALLRENVKELDAEVREREAQLRYAVIDLSLDRGRLTDSGHFNLESLHDLDFQIGQLEQRLGELYRERQRREAEYDAQIQGHEQALPQALSHQNQLHLRLLHQLHESRDKASYHPGLRESFEELDAMLREQV